MTKLLRVDFRRVLKDKLFLVVCIIGAAFALVTPLLYVLISGALNEMGDAMMESLVTAKAQFFGAFSLGNNFGLIAPVLLSIVLCKDFSNGTVRNKIIGGKSRNAIFLSMFTVCAVCLFGIMLLHALLTLGISLVFFEYQPGGFGMADLGYFFASLAFELLVYVFVAALISFLCASMKNVGLVIVLFVAIDFVLIMIGSILQISAEVLTQTGGSESVIRILEFFQRINVFQASATIGLGTAYSLTEVLYLVLVPLVSAAGLLGLGMLKFRKKDLK